MFVFVWGGVDKEVSGRKDWLKKYPRWSWTKYSAFILDLFKIKQPTFFKIPAGVVQSHKEKMQYNYFQALTEKGV